MALAETGTRGLLGATVGSADDRDEAHLARRLLAGQRCVLRHLDGDRRVCGDEVGERDRHGQALVVRNNLRDKPGDDADAGARQLAPSAASSPRPRLWRRSRRLPDLAVEGCRRRGVDDHASSDCAGVREH
jgi:hypothetical protein